MTEAGEKSTAVVGGGFAGIAAACRLAADGHRPVLFERAPRLGGRAASFMDSVSGECLDYGHHVSMRCCTATDGLLRRIGAGDMLSYQESLSVPIRCGDASASVRSASWLPGLLHLLPSLPHPDTEKTQAVGGAKTSMRYATFKICRLMSWP